MIAKTIDLSQLLPGKRFHEMTACFEFDHLGT
jgi:hypothetical protein